MRRYWRVAFLAANGRLRRVWATNYNDPGAGGRITFEVVDKNGDERQPRREVVYAAPRDVKSLRVAQFNNTYATLEVRR